MTGDLVPRAGGQVVTFGVDGVRWTLTGLELPAGLSFEDYEHVGFMLGKFRDGTAFGLGDWILGGEILYGERYAQAIEVTGRAKSSLMNIASVARRVPRERRRQTLSWSHHAEVASLEPAEQGEWLDRCERERMSVEELRGLLRPKDLPTSVGPRVEPSEEELALVAGVRARRHASVARAQAGRARCGA